MKKGIAIAGNIIVDEVKHIAVYPNAGMLSRITKLDKSVGGVVGNTAVDLAIMDPMLPLQVIAVVGDDQNGQFALDHLWNYGISCENIQISTQQRTSFTDVMQDASTGQRTFFTYGGADGELCYDRMDFTQINTDIFHLGYALLLQGMDDADDAYGTVMAKTLAKVQSMGIKTSMDVVSEQSERAAKIVCCSAKYCDYFIVNEIEAGMTVGLAARDHGGALDAHIIEDICKKLFATGVKEWVVIHAPEMSFAMHKNGEYCVQPTFDLPEGFIAGSVGAGDAFSAGVLYGLYHQWDMKKILFYANAAAAACLQGAGGTDAMRSKEKIFELADSLPVRQKTV